MPIFGVGLHILVALFFAVHAIRTGRNMYWLLILFSFPLLGSVVYLFAEYLPGSGLNRKLNKAAVIAGNLLDPEKELRAARHALELSPSAQNQVRLAKALLAHDDSHEAVKLFNMCLAGPFGKEPDIRLSAAIAMLHDGQIAPSLALCQGLRHDCPDFMAEKAGLLLAQVHAAAGDVAEARSEFINVMQRFGSVEVRAEYAVWAAGIKDLVTAEKLRAELAVSEKHWDSYTRSLNRDFLKRMDAAIEAAKRG